MATTIRMRLLTSWALRPVLTFTVLLATLALPALTSPANAARPNTPAPIDPSVAVRTVTTPGPTQVSGNIHILTGAHGLPSGSMVADASMYADDVARFGDLPGVTVHDVASMSPEAISGVLQRPGTIIGGFCDSTACLGAFR